ncbi:Ig-like domain-containing protein, partial [Pseudoroseomonas wenyumeiae]
PGGDAGGGPGLPDAPGTPDAPAESPLPVAPPLLRAEAEAGLEDNSLALRITLAGGATDGRAEVLGLRVEGLPPGASLSAGLRDPASGAWVVPPEALAGLTLTPPADFSGEIRLVLRALAMQPDGTLLTAVQALNVTVAPVADAALIDASPAAGREDVPLALNLRIAPADADGSESLASVLLSGLPPGARIAPGEGITDHGDGTWSVVPAHLAAVMLIPPEHASGGMRLTVTAVTMEAASGATRATAQEVAVSFAPVPQAPLLQAGDAAGREDQPIALDLGATLADRDGSEILSLVLEGLPRGARLSAGVNNGDGSWTLTSAQLAGLTLTPPGNWSGRMALTLVAHAMEGADASHATSRAGFAVEVEAVADRPMLDVAATAEGGEDSLLALDLRARLADGDGSESLFLRVTGVPAGSRFNAGSENADGSWTIPGDALPGLGFQPPRDYSGTPRLRFTALAAEGNGDAASTDPVEMSITVRPVTDAPLLALADATGAEDQPLALSIAAAPGDADGSESLLRVLVQGVPSGAKLSAGSRGADGTWTLLPSQLAGLSLTPPAHFSGPLQLTVTAVAAEAATGAEASTTGTMTLQVTPVADAPVLTALPASGTEDHSLALSLGAALVDRDDSERLLDLQISGLPEGFSLSAGTRVGGGAWTVPAASLAGLRLTPAPDWNGTLHLTVTATGEEAANGARASSSQDFTVSIAAVNDAPVLLLAPAGQAGQAGAPVAALLGEVQATDIDSPQLGGAVVTLGGARPGDRLGFDGYVLHAADGHSMISDTGIELVNGGYDAASGRITLRGAAPPEVYSAVLQSLVLENAGTEGLAAGQRSVSIVVRDSEGVEAVQQSVTLAVEPPPPVPEPVPQADPQAVIEASVLAAQDAFAGHAATDWTAHLHAAPWADAYPSDAGIDHAAPPAPVMLSGEDFHILHSMLDRPH